MDISIKRKISERGSAMTMVMAGVVMAAAVLLALLETSGSANRATQKFVDDQGVYYAAQGATELALSEVWSMFDKNRQTYGNDYNAFLNNHFTWTVMPAGVDVLADQMRLDNGEVQRATISSFDTMKLGNRVVSQFYIYRRARNVLYPNSTIVKQYNWDMLAVAESQKDLGFNTGSAQAKSFGVDQSSITEKTNLANANWVGQFITVSNPPAYKGLEYGLLTKNVQCTFCHLHVNSVEKAFNKDPKKFNTFQRIKVASTNFMGVPSGDVQIEGTLYQRGRLEDDNGTIITVADAASRMKATVLNSNGTIKQNTTSGATTLVVDTNTPNDPTTGAPALNGNFYANYPLDPTGQTDGIVPADDFPSPFPDLPKALDNNRANHKIDADELDLAKTDAKAVSDPSLPGKITGGVAVMIQPGAMFDSTVLPNAGDAANITREYTGNVVLTGTASNPIMLDGKVVIDGDVIIRGYVQGTGQIYTTGNIYIPGDVIYKNRTDVIKVNNANVTQEAFGQDSAGKQNMLGLVAGKNIIVGDYLSQVTHWNTHETSSNECNDTTNPSGYNGDYFAPCKLDVNTNKVISLRGQPEPGRILTFANDKYLNPPYANKVSVIPGTYTDCGKTYSKISQPNFTMFQLAMFNQMELTRTLKKLPVYTSSANYNPKDASKYTVDNNATNNPSEPYDPDYIPRFYSFYSYDATTPTKNPIYITTTGWQQSPYVGGKGGTWDTVNKRWNLMRHSGDPVNFTDLNDMPTSVISPTALAKKNVINIHPDWVTPENMMKIISSEELTRQTGTRRIDGLLYTSNAMIAVERPLVQVYNPTTSTWSNAKSRGSGNLTVNGAVIAPDMGVIVPSGMYSVNYDQRVAGFLNLTSSPQAGGNIAGWGMERKGFTRNSGPIPQQPIATTNTANQTSTTTTAP